MNSLRRLLVSVIALALALPMPAAGQSAWSLADRQSLEQREAAIWPTETRTARSATGLVSATASPVAVRAGTDVLRSGGTAADAAVATAFAQITMMQGANVSFAGVAQLLYYDARTGRVHAMDAGWNGWRNERSPNTIPATDLSLLTGTRGDTSGAAGRKTLVPGFVAGMAAMHRRFGRLSLRQLLAPSIWYARHGVPVTPLTGAYFPIAAPQLSQTPAGRHFLMPDGVHVATLGDRHASPELARLLDQIAAHGAAAMYRGRWARAFVAAVNAAGGAATMADMAAYRVRWAAPLRIAIGDVEVMAPPPPDATGCAMLTALNVLHHAAAEQPYWQDPQAFRTTALTLRLATILGWSPAMGEVLQRHLGSGGDCAARLQPGFGAAAATRLDELLAAAAPPVAGHHSAAVVVIDRWGNIAALVHSSNTPLWGDTGLVVQGVPIPAPAGLYRDALTRISPGGRVPSDMAPLIALRSGKPLFGVAAVGSSLLQETVRVTAGLIQRTGRLDDLVAAPPLLLNYQQIFGEELVPAGRYPPAFLDQVRAAGMAVREVDMLQTQTLKGTVAVAMLQPDGSREGVEVPQILAFAQGE
ncbi:gamma-glutamyltransferase [Sphingomonas sp. RT2P30]|uniref:gamma-glutamyltransferase n=1 Tax=Parasphingomonas halimpatiens TaxID=3096162 RepID=UPI002FC9CAF0